MREIELKSVVADEAPCTERLLRAGATPILAGRLEDRRFDTPDRALLRRGLVLRVRVTRCDGSTAAALDWKGPASYEGGFKRRNETSVAVADAAAMTAILEGLGLVVSREIDRDIRVFALDGVTVRFERFPRMDGLVEVEGEPDAIERAIAVLGIPRSHFTPDRLAAFVARYESRTGQRAAVSDREARGEYRYARDDA
jgi:adenylate cyclase class IV